MAQTGRNMQVRFDMKVVLECWDNGIWYSKWIFMIGSPSALCWTICQQDLMHTFFPQFPQYFTNLMQFSDNSTKWFYQIPCSVLMVTLFSSIFKKIMLLPHLWKSHHEAFKKVTTKMSQIMDVFYFNVNIRTKHSIIYHSWAIYSKKTGKIDQTIFLKFRRKSVLLIYGPTKGSWWA